MAVVILFSTLSFTLDMHYCGDTLVDVALFSKAKSCGMEINPSYTCKTPTVKKGCCSETELIHQANDELRLLTHKLNFSQQLFVASFVYSYASLYQDLQEHVIPFKAYSPPLVVKDIQLLDEVFLI